MNISQTIKIKKAEDGYEVFRQNEYIGSLYKEQKPGHSSRYVGSWKAYSVWIFDHADEDDAFLNKQRFHGNLDWDSFKEAKQGLANLLS